jgi:hypothetical protein
MCTIEGTRTAHARADTSEAWARHVCVCAYPDLLVLLTVRARHLPLLGVEISQEGKVDVESHLRVSNILMVGRVSRVIGLTSETRSGFTSMPLPS